MTVGTQAVVTAPSDYAYGEQGVPGLIPPHSELIFELMIVGIKGKGP